MPEGDTIERIAQRLQPLVGTVPAIATPHPRTAALRIAERLAGQALQRIEARGKHLLMVFDSGLVLHVHLRMTGRFRIAPAGMFRYVVPLTASGSSCAGAGIRAVLFDGPVLELLTPAAAVAAPGAAPARRRRHGRRLRPRGGGRAGCAAAIRRTPSAARCSTSGCWRASATSGAPRCCTPSASAPARQLRTLDDATLERIATTAATMLHGPRPRAVYGRTGRPCPRCGTPVTSGVVGDDGRRSYWCPGCQT